MVAVANISNRAKFLKYKSLENSSIKAIITQLLLKLVRVINYTHNVLPKHAHAISVISKRVIQDYALWLFFCCSFIFPS